MLQIELFSDHANSSDNTINFDLLSPPFAHIKWPTLSDLAPNEVNANARMNTTALLGIKPMKPPLPPKPKSMSITGYGNYDQFSPHLVVHVTYSTLRFAGM